MKIVERESGDIAELSRRARSERRSIQRDRYRAVLLALEGEDAVAIAKATGRARRSVQEWVYAYRDCGIDALIPKKQTGKPPRLTAEQETQLKARLDAGPAAEDGVCALRGKDVVRILKEEFGVKHTIGSIYGVLHRLGYSCLSPRPQHEKNDPAAIEQFKRDTPFLSRP
jgi:transposase